MGARRTRVLELAVLGLLYETPLHGYGLRKRLNSELGVFRAFSYGSLYPCLKEMLRQGHISQHPEETGFGRRPRIVYRLTEAGHEHLHGMLADVTPAACDDECFGVYFALFGHARSDLRLRILHGRRDRLLSRLEELRSRPSHTADDYLRELRRHGAESVEREIHWLDELIAREQRSAAPSPPQPGSPG
ncbi:PadR family transcriptional regulator [Thermobifida alba]|jgi:DNA-binding PadR family transcriptional regulator|uniref:PadR family transcriptional regulator n=1 Tax=Thermobifida alba TaxID=53522 RepID=A0ABY4L6A8_THEAE|nr:PadR family transcriptional regulator [Thermobifida alba]UPT22431.1 PadR family transcriptional regulator [Thermobifida alba]HLU97190.1 PadR family transcriptional regulator [Thermobifida alba]